MSAIGIPVALSDSNLECGTEVIKQIRDSDCNEEGESLKERSKDRDFCVGIISAPKFNHGHIEEECDRSSGE